MEQNDSKGLVIFIHGFMGNTRLFDSFSGLVRQQGYITESLLLPGHGGSSKEFSSSTFEQWQGHVDAEILRASEGAANILLVGHSMGGLLALNAASRLSGHVHGVFLIASPFKLAAFSPKANLTRLKYIFYRKTHPVKAAFLENGGIRFSPFVLLHMIKPYFQLRKCMRETRDRLPDISVPVAAVYSLSDELSDVKSLDILRNGLSGVSLEYLLLSDSLHAYFPPHERPALNRTLIDFLQ